jgi:hypothetical protein
VFICGQYGFAGKTNWPQMNTDKPSVNQTVDGESQMTAILHFNVAHPQFVLQGDW